MRPINFQPYIITLSSQDEGSSTVYRLEGIKFDEGGKNLFIITELLCEKLPYIKDGYKEVPVTIGTVVLISHYAKEEIIEMDTKRFKYWKQFVKMRHI